MNETPALPALPVLPTIAAAWRLIATRPLYVLRTGWVPVLVVFGVGAAFSGDTSVGGPAPVEAFWAMASAVLNFALLVLVLVAWQRSALPGAKLRKGSSALRLGRAELLAMAHFPLVGFFFVPLLLPEIVESLLAIPNLARAGSGILLPVAGVAVLVFPGGLLLTRSALFLVAIAEAGRHPIALGDTANRVWGLGGGNSIRLFLVLYLAVLPVIAVMAALPDSLHVLLQAALRGVLLTLYVMVAGGALAGAYAALGGTLGPAAQRKLRRGAA